MRVDAPPVERLPAPVPPGRQHGRVSARHTRATGAPSKACSTERRRLGRRDVARRDARGLLSRPSSGRPALDHRPSSPTRPTPPPFASATKVRATARSRELSFRSRSRRLGQRRRRFDRLSRTDRPPRRASGDPPRRSTVPERDAPHLPATAPVASTKSAFDFTADPAGAGPVSKRRRDHPDRPPSRGTSDQTPPSSHVRVSYNRSSLATHVHGAALASSHGAAPVRPRTYQARLTVVRLGQRG